MVLHRYSGVSAQPYYFISLIPTAMTGLVHSASDLYILRACIGIVGGMCQHWTVCMFADEIVGTANGIVAGWGNLGGGVTQLIMGSVLFPLFTTLCGSTEQAWRTVSIVPAVVAFSTGLAIYFFSDDCPKGNYGDLKKRGVMKDVSLAKSAMTGSLNWATWIMFIQYACCFGVELTMQNAAVLYFVDQFGQSTESAAAIASIFGWMNLFARGMGGFLSDVSNSYFGKRGRIWAHTICLLMEGAFVLFFSSTTSLGMAIGVMIVFSTFVQAAEGTSFGIVPYISRANVGTVTGIGRCGW
jgi:MFS transporter, NNP family, nitrate/nitrite transporter